MNKFKEKALSLSSKRDLVIQNGPAMPLTFHITCRTLDQKFFPLPLEDMWFTLIHRLKSIHQKQGLAIHALVLMGNHFHLLCQVPRDNLQEVLANLLVESFWEEPHLEVIETQAHYFKVYRYIFQNPVRAGLVERVEYYPYSSHFEDVPFPLHSFVPMSFGGLEGELRWLNEVPDANFTTAP